MKQLVEGPGWAPHSLDVRPGRFPLSVEAHLLNMTAKLVPGATTVTINARYYGLHGLVALEAERRGLDADQAAELLRRCEVVVAGASIVHPDDVAGVAHGHDRVKPRLEADGFLDVRELSVPRTGYANPRWGFLGPYVGSELTLRILAGADLTPGVHTDKDLLRRGFDGLFDLAAQDQVSLDDLRGCPQLANGAGRIQPDGPWLSRLMSAVGVNNPIRVDATRRATVRLLARSVVLLPRSSATDAFRSTIAYGSGLRTDRVVSTTPEAEAWRGTLFRHDSVGAWRELWAWLVRQISGLTPPSELIGAMVSALPGGSLSNFLAELPNTIDANGDPAPAEEQVHAEERTTASRCLAQLALGAMRTSELEGRAREALVGNSIRPTVLGPLWTQQWLDDRRDRDIVDVAAQLVTVLLERAQRIALKKRRLGKDGRIWLPTRVHERGELLYRVGEEGSSNVGLRLRQLAGILQSTGALERVDATWRLSPAGEELLGVREP